MFPVLVFVSLATVQPAPAPRARVVRQGMTCTVRPLVQGSGTVRECVRKAGAS